MYLFSLAPNPYLVFPVVSLLIFAYLLYRVYKFGPQSRTNKWFIAYLLIAILSGIPDFFVTGSTNKHDATFGTTLFMALNTLTFYPYIILAIVFTQRNKIANSNIVKVALAIPPSIVIFLILFTNLIITHNPEQAHMVHLMWIIPKGPLWPLYVLWIQAVALTDIILFLIFAHRVQDPIRKKQGILFATAFVVQVTVDLLLQVILPSALKSQFLPDGIASGVILVSITAFGILKYNLFVVNPATIAENIIESMNDLLIVINSNGNIEFTNNTAQKILGYAPQELIGKHVKMLLGERWKQFEESLFTPLLQEKNNLSIQSILYKKDQSFFPVNFSASVFRQKTGSIAGVVCVATDISQLLQLKDITVQRDTLRKVIESFKDVVFALDINKKVIIYNSVGLSLFGLKSEDIIGRQLSEIITFEEEDNKTLKIEELLDELFNRRDSDTIHKYDVKISCKSGKQLTMNLTITSIQEKFRSDLFGIVTLQDLSREKELEQMKLDFVSMAAHELRTPLTSIRGYLSVFMEENIDKFNEEQSMFLNRINISTQVLLGLVENLLNVSRIERGTFTVKLNQVDWISIIQEAMNSFMNLAKEKNIALSFRQSKTPIKPVMADRLRIVEVLNNLLSNAINYTNPGGSVSIQVEEKNNTVITHIQDTGEGIPKQALPHLFTKFFRVSGKLEQGSKGTGLGLYISKSIIELHHGNIWVESESGKGSIFSFSLPIYNL